MAAMARSLALLLAAALAGGCGHSLRQVSPAFPRQDPVGALSGDLAIHVTERDLDTPYRALALIETGTHRRERLETEGVAELRALAARLHADAVIRVQAHPEMTEEVAYRPGHLTRVGTRFVTVYSLSGMAVAYDEVPAAQWPAPPPPLSIPLPPVN